MHNNALNGCFDPTLEKYSLNNKQKLALLKPPIREANLFDQTLEKYKPKLATPVRSTEKTPVCSWLLSTVTPITPIFTPKANLAEIWNRMCRGRPLSASYIKKALQNMERLFTR